MSYVKRNFLVKELSGGCSRYYFKAFVLFYVSHKVNCKLRDLADFCTENTGFLNKLADQTEDFAVQLIDQVNASEELVIHDGSENVDRYASMLSGLTDDAIVHSQKKVSGTVK